MYEIELKSSAQIIPFFQEQKENDWDPLIWELAEPSCNRWAVATKHEMGKEGGFENLPRCTF